MSKRSISKDFKKDTELGELYDWLGLHLPAQSMDTGEFDSLTQDIRLTINLDPSNKMSMIPEGPKIPNHHARTRG